MDASRWCVTPRNIKVEFQWVVCMPCIIFKKATNPLMRIPGRQSHQVLTSCSRLAAKCWCWPCSNIWPALNLPSTSALAAKHITPHWQKSNLSLNSYCLWWYLRVIWRIQFGKDTTCIIISNDENTPKIFFSVKVKGPTFASQKRIHVVNGLGMRHTCVWGRIHKVSVAWEMQGQHLEKCSCFRLRIFLCDTSCIF